MVHSHFFLQQEDCRMCNLRAIGASIALVLSAMVSAPGRADFYQATFLVSDIQDLGQITDPLLVNPWGVAFAPTGPFWVSNFGSATATVYAGDSNGDPLVKVPVEISIPGGSPTGIVSNGTSDFGGAIFIFAGFNGTINAWSFGNTEAVVVATVDGASYTGLAMGQDSDGNNLLYAANGNAGTIDVFDGDFNLLDTGGAFADPDLDPKYTPFNIQNIKGTLYVTYINSDDEDHGGALATFDADGNPLGILAIDGILNAPWGLALAPAQFGTFSNKLLVGNFGDGRISALDPDNGDFLGFLSDDNGNPWVFEDLWALTFGNGGAAGDSNTLYFTAGINDQQDGLFGSLKPAN
jgi:uncharacterized protein (TIGR03118 family)